MRSIVIASLTVLALVGCDKPPVVFGPGVVGPGVVQNTGMPSVPPRHVNAGSRPLEYTFNKVSDQQVVAYTYLGPKGWIAADSIQWTGGKMSYPFVRLDSQPADKSHRLSVYPMIGGNSWSGQYGSGGKSYRNASEAIDGVFFSKPEIKDFTVVHEESRPARTVWTALQGHTVGAEVCVKRCTYSNNGVEKEAIVTAKLDLDVTNEGGSHAVLWHLSAQVMVAPKGQLVNDPVFLKEAATFFTSARITPEYDRLANNISFEQSQINRKAALDENRQIMKNYWDGQKSMEKGMKDFDDYIRGVGTFGGSGGNGPKYELPTGGHYWTDGNGTIRSSDDPNYDPNEGGGNGWTPLNQIPG